MSEPLRTTVIGSYPLPAWLEYASQHLDAFGADDLAEMLDDAVTVAVNDQLAAGLTVVTDGEQTRLDFNLSFYGFSDGHRAGAGGEAPVRAARSRSARETRGDRRAAAPRGLGVVEEFRRLKRIAPAGMSR